MGGKVVCDGVLEGNFCLSSQCTNSLRSIVEVMFTVTLESIQTKFSSVEASSEMVKGNIASTNMTWLMFYFLVQVQLRTEVVCTPSSTQLGFQLMTSRS